MSGRFPVAVPGGFFKRPIAKGRDKSVIGFPKSLEPMRLTLRAQPYLGGEMPNYADDIVFGGFQWARRQPVQTARSRRPRLRVARTTARRVRWPGAPIAGLSGVGSD
jgi:hypothetical protein